MNPAELDPQEITLELRQASRSLAASAAKLGALNKEFNGTVGPEGFEPGPGKRFETAVKARTVVIYNHPEDGRRPPPEDVRQAMAEAEIRAGDPQLAADYDRLSTEIFALKQFISSQKAVISGHQSVLSASKVLSGLGQ